MCKKIFAICLISCLAFSFSGCGKNKTVQEKMGMWKEASIFMHENGFAGTATVTSSGDGNVYQKIAFGADTGISFTASVQFNSDRELRPTSQPSGNENKGNE